MRRRRRHSGHKAPLFTIAIAFILSAQADESLYCAKERGRNRVELASLEPMVERAREAMSPRTATASNAA